MRDGTEAWPFLRRSRFTGSPADVHRRRRVWLGFEFQVIVCPVVVGSGKRCFPEGVRLELELIEERRFRRRRGGPAGCGAGLMEVL